MDLFEQTRIELDPRGELDVDAAVPHFDFGAVVAKVRERAELVDREEVARAVAKLLNHVASTVCERLARVA